MTDQEITRGEGQTVHAHWCQDHDDPVAGCFSANIPFGDDPNDYLFLAQREGEPEAILIPEEIGALTIERGARLADALDVAAEMSQPPAAAVPATPLPRSAAELRDELDAGQRASLEAIEAAGRESGTGKTDWVIGAFRIGYEAGYGDAVSAANNVIGQIYSGS